MSVTLLAHIAAGSLALLFGYVALYAGKGGRLHRRSGMLFVYAMLAMSVLGVMIAGVRNVAPALNIPAGVLTFYLVVTALITVRPPAVRARWLGPVLMLLALGVGLSSLTFGLQAVAGGGMRNGMPAFPFFMFGIIGVLASAGDVRVIHSGALTGASRLARHLWRMCFALFIAALSFFIGQSDEFPAALRIMPVLALPVVAVLLTMLYWLWRVRIRRSLRGIVTARAPEAVVAGRT
jgi:hypothetical protein